MTLTVILTLNVRSGRSHELRSWLNDNLPHTQSYDGCLSVTALEHDANANKIVLVGRWESRPKWERYIRWRENRGDFQHLAQIIVGEPDFECYQQFGLWSNTD